MIKATMLLPLLGSILLLPVQFYGAKLPVVEPLFKVDDAGGGKLSMALQEPAQLSGEETLLLTSSTKRVAVKLRSGRCEFNVYNDVHDKKNPIVVLSLMNANGGSVEPGKDGDSFVLKTEQMDAAGSAVECVLQNGSDGKLNFTWTNVSDVEGARIVVSSRKSFEYRGASQVGVNRQWLTLKSPEEMKSGSEPSTWCRNELATTVGGEISLYPEGATAEAKLEISPDAQVRTFQTIWNAPLNQRMGVSVGATSKGKTLTITLDIGDIPSMPTNAAVPAMTYEMYWQSDRMRVPRQPTRNILPNPSLEQDLRYWSWRTRGGGPFFEYDADAPPCYEIVSDARLGKKSLKINNTYGGIPIETFPVTTKIGKEYTLSVYTKGSSSLNLSITPVFNINNIPGKGWNDFVINETIEPSEEWQRSVIHFKAELPAHRILLNPNGSDIYVDGLQLEEGNAVTDFTSPNVEGLLLSSNSDNALEYGTEYDFQFTLQGKPKTAGEVVIRAFDFYNQTVFETKQAFDLGESGSTSISLEIDPERLGKGVFILEADYLIKGQLYYSDYYRFSVLDFLSNTHPSKDLFGAQYDGAKTTRGDELGAYFQKWGFGSIYSLAYVMGPDFYEKYKLGRLTNISSTSRLGSDRYKESKVPFSWDKLSPERAQLIEDISYESVVDPVRYGDVWAYTKEAEIKFKAVKKGDFEEFSRMMVAARKGVKKANPEAIFLPYGGTSGFTRTRGFPQMEGLLKASQKLGITWEGLAIHPYGLFDQTDEAIQDLIYLDDTYQPDANTRLFVNETSTSHHLNIPEWQKYDQWYSLSGRPTYDSGWHEFLNAARGVRLYLIALKYWPRVENMHLWNTRQFIDTYFAPLMICGATNTLGHLFPEPEFVVDFAPTSDIKGLVFKDSSGRGTAAIWSNSYKVENGFEEGPSLQLDLKGLDLEIIDLMGNPVDFTLDKNGSLELPLSPAPLYVRTKPGQVDALTRMLDEATVLGSSTLVEVKVLPTEAGISADLLNNTSQSVGGHLSVGDTPVEFVLDAYESQTVLIDAGMGNDAGVMYQWHQPVEIDLSNGYSEIRDTDLAYFFVPKVESPLPLDFTDARWETIPAIEIDNYYTNDIHLVSDADPKPAARYQLAWDDENLYLRVSGYDPDFVVNQVAWEKNPRRAQQLYKNDGSIEVYFDTFADANLPWKAQGYDNNDYRYDFYAGDGKAESGPASAYRIQEVFTEFANGTEMPKVEDVINGGIPSQFYREGNTFGYVIIFPQAYLLPLPLETGARTGFALFIQDRNEDGKFKGGLSLSIEESTAPNQRPSLWPVLILK